MSIQVWRGLSAVVAFTCDRLVTRSKVITTYSMRNETNWAFAVVGRVGYDHKPLV
jgi:hypothetical protein